MVTYRNVVHTPTGLGAENRVKEALISATLLRTTLPPDSHSWRLLYTRSRALGWHEPYITEGLRFILYCP